MDPHKYRIELPKTILIGKTILPNDAGGKTSVVSCSLGHERR